MQIWTSATVSVLVRSRGSPKPTSRIVNSTTAMSRFIVGPPSMTTTFFGTDSL